MLLTVRASACWASKDRRGAQSLMQDPAGNVVIEYTGSFALLIGASDYEHNADGKTIGWRDLSSIPGELDLVREVLEEHGFEVEMALNPNKQEMWSALREFIDTHGVVASHRLVIFFAGHGWTRDVHRKQQGFLAPVDAPSPDDDEKRFLQKAIPMAEIRSLAEPILAKHVLFVFDSCFSGAFLGSGAARSTSTYIDKSMSEPVRQFLTSGGPRETVPAKSVFTPAFVAALRGEADLIKDRHITGTELGLFLSHKMTGQSTPQHGRLPGFERGDIIFKIPESKSLQSSRIPISGSPADDEQQTVQVPIPQTPSSLPKIDWGALTSLFTPSSPAVGSCKGEAGIVFHVEPVKRFKSDQISLQVVYRKGRQDLGKRPFNESSFQSKPQISWEPGESWGKACISLAEELAGADEVTFIF